MPIATRTFRVFVSSTFEDLKAERDALQRDVFPRLRKLCEENGARFQAIDLRWGVRDEAALDQQTMEICLREIERCQQTGIKPNFIVLLGERYGWCPLPARIEAGEFEKVRERVADADKRLINGWYERDENAVPPEYLLKPRTGEFGDKDRWGELELRLHRILRVAARAAELAEAELVKYWASATHQEILKGLGQSEEDRKHVFAFFREAAEGAAVDAELVALEEDLRHKLPDANVRPFRIGEIEKLCADVEESLKKVILDETSRFTSRDALDLEIEAHDRFAVDRSRIFVGRGDALTAIADYLGGPERRPLVLHGPSGSGKSAVMAMASKQLKGPGRLIRRFIGASPESASGHALLTSLCKQIAPGETPVDYYKLERAFQERLFPERLSADTEEQPLILYRALDRFSASDPPRPAKSLPSNQPLVLFIDALDQLSASDPARAANWLPAELPPHVKIVVSTTENGERLPAGLQVRLERMTTAEGGQALDAMLRNVRRTLQPSQRGKVLAHFKRCGLPLYLKLAAEESRLWNSFAPLDVCMLGVGVAGVIDTLFGRLASNANHGQMLVERSLGYLVAARYGLTEGEMLDVLTADDAVWDDFNRKKHHEVSERRMPVVVWSRLSLDLEPYLTERAAPGGTVISYYHRQLAERVMTKFLAGNEKQARHGDLAGYFYARAAWLDQGHKTPNARRAAELPFQQREAQLWAEAEATLFDCPFLFSKVAAGMVLDLDDDYRAVFKDSPKSDLRTGHALRLIHGALRLSLNVLAGDPGQLASQMVGRLLPHEEKFAIRSFMDEIAKGASRPWLRPLHPALATPGGPLIRTLQGHSAWVNAVATLQDGRRALSASDDKMLKLWDLETGQVLKTLEGHSSAVNAVALLPDGRRALSASDDKTLKLWDLETGQILTTLGGLSSWVTAVAPLPDCKRALSASYRKLMLWDLETGQLLKTLEGHSGGVNAVALFLDGRCALSASEDKTLKLWDLETGQLLKTLEGHSQGVTAVAPLPDCRRALSASRDNTLKLWDLETGQLLKTLEDHAGWVWAVALHPDGRRALSAPDDRTMKLWDLDTGHLIKSLEGHSGPVHAIALLPDGCRALSASVDNTLKLWDLDISDILKAPEGHSHWVNAIVPLPDGRRALSASNDMTLKLWCIETGELQKTLEGHTGGVSAVAPLPDGRCALSGADDKTLKLWDLETGHVLRTLEGHTDLVTAVALLPDGRRALSSSFDRSMKLWDLETGQVLKTLEGRSSGVNAIALVLDGSRALCAGFKTLELWDLETGQLLKTLEGHSDSVSAAALYPDGRRALSASHDRTLKVWDLETGRTLKTMEGHSRWVWAIALLPVGERAVSASDDRTLRVWNLGTGAEVAAFTCDGPVSCCTVIDAGRMVCGDWLGRLHWLELVE